MTTSSKTGDEQAEHRGLDLLDQLVDDLVGTNLDAFGLGELAAALVGAHVETDDRGVEALASCTSFSVIPPTPRCTDDERDVVALELAQ